MNTVVFFFGSGMAFFAGVFLVVLAVGIVTCTRRVWVRVFAELLAVFGLCLVAASGTPLPMWLYAGLGIATFGWLFSVRFRNSRIFRYTRIWTFAVLGTWAVAVAWELPYHLMPVVPVPAAERLIIVGDSISAGIGEKQDITWPARFRERYGWTIDNRSKAGATVASIRTPATATPIEAGVVLLEIGGNDLLGGTTTEEFEQGLDALIQSVRGDHRTLVMLELPLPPFYNGFGMAQRRLAAKHGVVLIPKRVFISVLTTAGATTGGIHLSESGHVLMANRIGDCLGLK